MKYLKKYKAFELKSSTYLSAADKLSKNHPERSKKLRQWVDNSGDVDINYLDPRPLYSKDNVYYITKVYVQPDDTFGGLGNNIEVTLESASDIYTLWIYNWLSDGQHLTSVTNTIETYGTPWASPGYTRKDDQPIMSFPDKFYLDDRKSARIFMEIVEKEAGEKLLFSLNDIYKS